MAGRTIAFSAARTYGPLESPPLRNFIMTAGERVRLLLTVYERDGDTSPLNLAGMAAFFTFGRDGAAGDGTFVSFDGGQFYFDYTPDLRCAGQLPWHCSLSDRVSSSTIASGVINILPSLGERAASEADLITPAGLDYDARSGTLSAPDRAYRRMP